MDGVSIIIPHYGTGEFLTRLLQSLRAQTYPVSEREIIVVFDHSQPETVAQIQMNFPEVICIPCADHVGTAHAKNAGARCARYSSLVFLDSDVTISPDWIAVMMRTASHEPTVPCFQSKVLSCEDASIVRSTGGVANIYGYAWDRGIFEQDSERYADKRNILYASSCAMLIQKDVFDMLGGFDDDFFYMGEDYDLGLRLWETGYEIAYVPQAVCFHEEPTDRKDFVLHAKYYLERNRLLIMCKHYEWTLLMRLMLPLLCIKIVKYVQYVSTFRLHRQEYMKEIIRGWMWIVFQRKNILEKRRRTIAVRKRSVADIFRIFPEYAQQLARVIPKKESHANCHLS